MAENPSDEAATGAIRYKITCKQCGMSVQRKDTEPIPERCPYCKADFTLMIPARFTTERISNA